MNGIRSLILIALCMFFIAELCGASIRRDTQENAFEKAAYGLLERILPGCSDKIIFESISPENGFDVFEIETVGRWTVIRGTDGVAMASGLNWYLKYYCNSHISWGGSQVHVPEPLPAVIPKVRRATPYKYRYMFNYCTFGYSMPWWDWEQWERHIDWMALNGVNLPLAVTGQEAVWREVLRKLGFSEKHIMEFLPGPPYLPFGWMGCLDGWGGPLPQSWIDGHAELQKRILARERELGMKPVLQGFTGHLPAATRELFPESKLYDIEWIDWKTTFLDPLDPLFLKVGKLFVEEQSNLFGTNHIYDADCFVEMTPPSSDPGFLKAVGRAILGAMKAADPQAIWLMQGWPFYFDRNFWKTEQRQAILSGVGDDEMIVLDLYAENHPLWPETEGYYGKQWLWCAIENFGGTMRMEGPLDSVNRGPNEARQSQIVQKMAGIGMAMEGFGVNTVLFDLLTEMTWRTEPVELRTWLAGYSRFRYGSTNFNAREAWRYLYESVYGGTYYTVSTIVKRPSLNLKAEIPYDALKLAKAWKQLLSAAYELGGVDTYQVDIVNVTCQVLADLSSRYYQEMIQRYTAGDGKGLREASERFLRLVRDIDRLLLTRKEFLLGAWLNDAKRWGTSEKERRLFEWNARNVITHWGNTTKLNEYAQKEWSGLLSGYYLKRWELFCETLIESTSQGVPFVKEEFFKKVWELENTWISGTEEYPADATGSPAAAALEMFHRYGKEAMTAR